VLEHLSSGSLSDLLHDRRGTNWLSTLLCDSMLCQILHQVAVGLAYLHMHHFMHRDVKSSNVLLTADLNAKVSDFGISKAIQACEHVEAPDVFAPSTDALGPAGQGQHTVGVGTLRCMAPELIATRSRAAGLQARVATSHYGPSCDVYSFGILLWEVTHRSRPFAGMPSHEAAQAALRDERPPIQLAPKLAGYRTIIERCWLREPALRPLMASVAADIRELRDVAQVQDVLNHAGSFGEVSGAGRHTGQHVFVDGQPEDDFDHHTAKLGAEWDPLPYLESGARKRTGQHVLFVDGQPEDDVDHHTAKLSAEWGPLPYLESE